MRQIKLTYKTKINLFLVFMAFFLILGLFFFITSDMFKFPTQHQPQVKTADASKNALTSQSKPTETVQQFLTSLHDTMITQILDPREVDKSLLVLSKKLQDQVKGKTSAETFQNLLKVMDLTEPNYTSIEVTDSYFKNGETIVQTKLKYENSNLKRNFSLYIEDSFWKINEVQLVNKIAADPDDMKGWKTFTTQRYSIMTPQSWYTYGSNPAEIQNFETSVTDLTKLNDGSVKLSISFQKADVPKTTDELISCDSFANNECILVEINGVEFKKLVASSQYETNNAVILMGQKNGYTYIISGVVLDKSGKNLFNSMLESISTLRIY